MRSMHSRHDPHAVIRAVNQRIRWRRIKRYIAYYGAPALFVTLVVLFLTSCCTQPIADSAADLKREFAVYQRAVVPNPAYDAAAAAKVRALGERITAHIDAIERYARETASEGKGDE